VIFGILSILSIIIMVPSSAGKPSEAPTKKPRRTPTPTPTGSH
jgi:MFS transporter, DHA2 family, multidrug resistance protein